MIQSFESACGRRTRIGTCYAGFLEIEYFLPTRIQINQLMQSDSAHGVPTLHDTMLLIRAYIPTKLSYANHSPASERRRGCRHRRYLLRRRQLWPSRATEAPRGKRKGGPSGGPSFLHFDVGGKVAVGRRGGRRLCLFSSMVVR